MAKTEIKPVVAYLAESLGGIFPTEEEAKRQVMRHELMRELDLGGEDMKKYPAMFIIDNKLKIIEILTMFDDK